jgi:hypothetical protein
MRLGIINKGEKAWSKVSLSTNKPRNAPIESKDAGKFARKRAESSSFLQF